MPFMYKDIIKTEEYWQFLTDKMYIFTMKNKYVWFPTINCILNIYVVKNWLTTTFRFQIQFLPWSKCEKSRKRQNKLFIVKLIIVLSTNGCCCFLSSTNVTPYLMHQQK